MSYTLWADVSEHQPPVDDSYPHPVLAFRSNDGSYRDTVCAQNLAWAKAACDSGRLAFFITYLVYYPNWQDGVAALRAQVGTPHPRMVVMIDVESWGGTITGDQSAGITAQRDAIAAWLGDPARVIAYGNKGDLAGLYPHRPADLRLVVASYGSPPDATFPGFIAQQYTDAEQTAPFGPCDMNLAPGLDPAALAAALGVGAPPPAQPPTEDDDMQMIQSSGRGIALVGPGFFRQLISDEEVIQAGPLCPRPVLVGNDRQFDVWRSLASGAAPAPVSVDVPSLAAALAPHLAQGETIQAAVTTALKTITLKGA
jgi:hypothetical protein